MPNGRPGLIRRFFGFIWRSIDFTRRFVFNVIFLLLLAFVIVAFFSDSRPRLQANTALVLNMHGALVEEYSGSSAEAAVAQALGEEERETQLRDVLRALEEASVDPKIARVVLVLDDFDGAGLASLREVAAALQRFKKSGKEVVAWASNYDQRRYFIAAAANEVYLHPDGAVLLTGFGGYQNYYRDALDKLGLSVQVFRVGTYKSFAEPYTQNAPSKEAAEADAFWLNDAWATYTSDIEQARKLESGAITTLINDLPKRFAAVQGDTAKLVLNEKLVDGLKTRDELRAMMIERGAADTKHKTFRQISLHDYLATLPADGFGPAVGVVVAQGEIVSGDMPQGVVGDRSTVELIRRARHDDAIKALVLRVDSPGGSAFASEVIRRELELTQKAGKPVVISMGDVAASGGYWISMASDEVLADEATITGSIGVIAMLPNAEKAWEKLGLHTGGVTTTWLAGAIDPRRPLDKRVGELLQLGVEHSYKQFITQAAAARKTAPDKINEVAQGRVWTGKQAKERGLIDTLGGLQAAIAAAAARAQLDDDYRVEYVEREPKGIDRFLSLIFGTAVKVAVNAGGAEQSNATAALARLILGDRAAAQAQRDLAWVQRSQREPFATYSHCLCQAPQ